MNERLDYLLSVALDDELDSAEQAELEQLLADHPDAVRRRDRFEAIDNVVGSLGSQAAAGDVSVESGLADLRVRLDGSETTPAVDAVHVGEIGEPDAHRTSNVRWLPAFALAAAATLFIVLVFPDRSEVSTVASTSSPTPAMPSRGVGFDALVQGAASEGLRFVDDPIALAVVFELDDESDRVEPIDSESADDFEIIEQLELLEYLAAREAGRS